MLEKLKRFLFKNTSAKQTVAKNTVWLSISNFGGRIIKAIVIIYGARLLGTAGWGVFSYAVTLAGFLTLFMDPGVNTILVREAAKADEARQRVVFATTFVMKVILLAFGIVVILFIAPFFSTLPGAKALLPIVALILAGDTLREFFSSLIRAKEKMEWEAGLFLLTNACIVIFGLIFLKISPTVASFSWGYVAGTTIGGIAAAIVLRKYLKTVFVDFSRKLILPIFRSAWPFMIIGALGLLLTNTDILIISWMKSASDVGIYSAAIRMIQVLYIVPGIIQTSTLPLFARLANHDNKKFSLSLERTLIIIFLVSIPLGVGGAILGTQIMQLVFGSAFVAGGLSFRILMISMMFDFPASILAAAIFAYDHQKSLIASSAIAGIANVALDLLLIPIFGIAGSAVATLVAQIFSNWYLWHAMDKLNHFAVFPRLGKIIGASAIMGIIAGSLFLFHVNVILNVIISVVVYILALGIFKEPTLGDLKQIVLPDRTAPTIVG